MDAYDKKKKTILVVGAASNEGADFCIKTLQESNNVKIIGVDRILSGDEGAKMYDTLDKINHIVNKKYAHNPELQKDKIWLFFDELLSNPGVLDNIFLAFKPDEVWDFTHNYLDLLDSRCQLFNSQLYEP